jgi:hypothetical protein
MEMSPNESATLIFGDTDRGNLDAAYERGVAHGYANGLSDGHKQGYVLGYRRRGDEKTATAAAVQLPWPRVPR